MQPRDRSNLLDILSAAQLIQEFVSDVNKLAFEQDPLIQSAVIRQLEIIGEATKRLSDEFRSAHPDIPWRKMSGMRDILIHAYDHVDTDEVWITATQSIPDLVQAIERLLPSEGQ